LLTEKVGIKAGISCRKTISGGDMLRLASDSKFEPVITDLIEKNGVRDVL
jgi:hypothetical protein